MDSPYLLVASSLANSSSSQRSIYLIQPLRKNGVERFVRTPFNRYMSLRLGIASISSSATRVASKVFGTVASDLKEEDKEDVTSDDEGSKQGDAQSNNEGSNDDTDGNSRGGNSLDGGTSAYPSDLVVDDLVTTSSIVGNVDDVADATTSDISIDLDVDATNQHDKLDDDGSPNVGVHQEGDGLVGKEQLRLKKNKKNNLGSLVWFYLLAGVSILVVDGLKQSKSRFDSVKSGIDVTYAADSIVLACGLNSDVVIDKGSDSIKVKIVEMQDLHLDGNVSSSESSKVAKAIDAEGSIAEVCNDMSISLCVEACCNGPGVELTLKDYTLKRTHAEYDVATTYCT